jgi:hypothetical protein
MEAADSHKQIPLTFIVSDTKVDDLVLSLPGIVRRRIRCSLQDDKF